MDQQKRLTVEEFTAQAKPGAVFSEGQLPDKYMDIIKGIQSKKDMAVRYGQGYVNTHGGITSVGYLDDSQFMVVIEAVRFPQGSGLEDKEDFAFHFLNNKLKAELKESKAIEDIDSGDRVWIDQEIQRLVMHQYKLEQRHEVR